MQRTSALLYAGQLATAPLLVQRGDPDRAFERMYARMRREMDGFAFLEEAVAEGYRRRLRAYAATDGLSGLGWRIALETTAHRMGNRKRVAKLHAAHPELVDVPVVAPVIVVGLPRTGTTLSHNVLSRAPGCRGPELWEMFDMALPGSRTAKEEAKVQRRVRHTLRAHLKFSPDWDLIHRIGDPRAVEENAFLLDHSIMDLATAPMPGYWRYLTGDYDAGADWRFVKQALQVLSHGQPQRRWVLKHPGNLYHLPEIFEVFPDAQVVWTHRDPVTVFGSMCSMAESLHHLHMFAHKVEPRNIGRSWLQVLSHGIEKARNDRAALTGGERPRAKRGAAAFIDLPYARLMADPQVEVATLYQRLGLDWGDAEVDRLNTALRRPRDGKGRRHEYGHTRYGVDNYQIDRAFGDYMGMVRTFNA
jgi:hypothetical protein